MLLAGPSAAQFGPPPGPYAAAAFTYTGGELCQSVSRVSAESPLGRPAGIALSAAASAARMDYCANGYFPGTLYKDDLRLTARRGPDSATVTLTSASDEPFHSPSETDLGINLSRELSEPGARGVWTLGVNYATRRAFLRSMPMPYLGYRYSYDGLSFMLPFMVRWQFAEKLAFSASWQPVKYYKLGLNWKPSETFRADLEGGTGLDQFLPAGRPDKSEALYLQTSSVALKPAVRLSPAAELGAELGWRFKGMYYMGSRYDEYRERRRFNGGASAGLSFKYSFR